MKDLTQTYSSPARGVVQKGSTRSGSKPAIYKHYNDGGHKLKNVYLDEVVKHKSEYNTQSVMPG